MSKNGKSWPEEGAKLPSKQESMKSLRKSKSCTVLLSSVLSAEGSFPSIYSFWIEKPSRFNVLTIKTELIIKNNISVLNIKNAGNFGKNEVCDVLHSLLLTDV